MKIKWLGHSCFLLVSGDGIRVLTDPFDERVGYRLPQVDVDIVTTSHQHGDHNNTGVVGGSFLHVSKPGIVSRDGIEIKGVQTFHDEADGSKRGKNTVFMFTIDGVRVCHCGDLGHLLTPVQIEEIGVVDVLLLPVGGVYTVDYRSAVEVKNQLGPKITIPMHYKLPIVNYPLDGVEKFLNAAGGGEKIGRQEIEITNGELDNLPRIIVLDYK